MEKNGSLIPTLPFNFSDTVKPVEIYTDGASRGNPGPAGAGVHILLGDGTAIDRKKFLGKTTNNVAEYAALILGLTTLKERNLFQPLKIYSDSQLMVCQLNGTYKIRKAHLRKLAGKVSALLKLFPSYEIIHVPRELNRRADKLANEAINESKKEGMTGVGQAVAGKASLPEESPNSRGQGAG